MRAQLLPPPHSLPEIVRFGSWLGSLLLAALIGGLTSVGLLALGAPLWLAVLAFLAVLAVPLLPYWATLDRTWGRALMVLSILLALQSFHTIEHATQWFQFHVLGWPAAQSGGLISPLNAEVVHFTWNWLVLLTMAYLWRAGMRGWSGALMLAWATAHTLEHSYMFIRYLQHDFTQGLPGVLGSDGWLAQNASTNALAGFICELVPAIETTPRLDVHFWWNAGEVLLLALAAHMALRRRALEPQQGQRALLETLLLK